MGLLDRLRARVQLVVGDNDCNALAENMAANEAAASSLMQEGDELEASGQTAAALLHYEAALQQVPNLARAHFKCGNILLDRGDAKQALAAYQKALQLKPDSAATQFNIGNAWQQLGKARDAAAAYQAVIALKPDFVDAEIALGNVLEEMGQFDDAATHYQRAVAINPDCADPFFQQGVQLQDQNLPDQAQALYRKTLQINPDHLDARNNLGVLLIEGGELADAVALFQQVLQRHPRSADLHKNLGVAYMRLAHYGEAADCFRLEASIRPSDETVQINLGNALTQIGESENALACYENALTINPRSVEALFGQGTELQRIKQLERAESCYLRTLTIEPRSAEAHNNLGTIKSKMHQPGAAIEYYEKALAIKPAYADAYCNMSIAQQAIGLMEQAQESCRRALEISPDSVFAHNIFGLLLYRLERPDEAEMEFLRSIELQPTSIDAHNHLGVVFLARRQFIQAISCFQRVLEIDPRYVSAYVNLGRTSTDMGRIEAALSYLHQAIALDPDFLQARSNLLFSHNYLGDQPAEEMLAEAQRFGDKVAQLAQPFTNWSVEPSAERALRVGFVSGDLCMHPVGYFVESVFAALAHGAAGRMELIAYTTKPVNDEISQRIKSYCSLWRTAVGSSDEVLARQIRDDRIDILIDLSGHTAYGRLPVFAWKPAPVQVSWLGYFATTGVTAIDYFLADPWTLPVAEEAYFTEKVWRLPETRLCFTAPDVAIDVSALPALSNGYVTLGCFNNLSKMNHAVVQLWARILHAVPGSRLFLKSQQVAEVSLRKEIYERFAQHGVDADRLILEDYGPRNDYLAAYQRVDFALDPFPFPGGTTTVEALWMGVPVLTLAGEHFLARQGVGLLMNVGLPQWVATDLDDYVAKAVSHANDLGTLAALRTGLRQQALASPIFDAPRFATHFEQALRAMWVQWAH